MALPPGLTARTVTIGIASFTDGSLAEGTATITAPVNLVHTPTNRPIFSSQMSKRFVDGEVTFDLLPTDAPGLNRTGWTYKLNVVVQGALVQPEPIWFLLSSDGPTELDLDGLVTVPSDSGIPVSVPFVTSVNGQTGDVVVDGGGGSGVDATDVGYDVVLLLGQSNMQGVNTDYDARSDPADPRVFSFEFSGTYADRIVSALDPLTHPGGATGAGPGLPFARWYARSAPSNRAVLLVPVAVQGTPLTPTTGHTWNSDVRNSLYDQAVTQAQQALAAAGANARIVAALWLQGESDGAAAQTPASGPTYQAAFDALIARLRVDLSLPALPFLVAGMSPEWIAGNNAVNGPIAAVHAATPTRVAYAGYAAGPSGLTANDGTHYTAAAMRVIGRSLLGALTAAKANTNPSGGGGSGATAPTAPTALTVGTPTQTGIPLTWAAPASDGGASVTDYVVQYRTPAGSGSWVTFTDGTNTATGTTVTGLTASTGYGLRVAAVNSAGTGTFTTEVTATTAAGSTPEPTVIASDNFNRADTTTTLGSTSTGNKPWTDLAGTWGIAGGEAYGMASANAVTTIDAGSANYRVEAKLTTLGNGATVLARCTAADNWYGFHTPDSTVYRRIGGDVTAIAGPFGNTVAGDTVGLSVQGSTITAYRNGTQLGQATDTSLTTGGPGLRTSVDTARFDDFTVYTS